MAFEIGWIGEEMNVLIRQGATVGPYFASMVNPDLTPVDLTYCTITGQIRKHPHDATVVLSWSVDIYDPGNGLYKFWLTDVQTAALECGDSAAQSKSQYVHDIELHDSTGNVLPLYYGKVSVFREVTR